MPLFISLYGFFTAYSRAPKHACPSEPLRFLVLILNFLNQSLLEWGLGICLFNELPTRFWGNQPSINLRICVMELLYNIKSSPWIEQKSIHNLTPTYPLLFSSPAIFPSWPFPQNTTLSQYWISTFLPSSLLSFHNFYWFFRNQFKCDFHEAFPDYL